jgi:hypothetical protein
VSPKKFCDYWLKKNSLIKLKIFTFFEALTAESIVSTAYLNCLFFYKNNIIKYIGFGGHPWVLEDATCITQNC